MFDAGDTNITGDENPVSARQPRQVSGAVKQKVNQMRRPAPEAGPAPPQPQPEQAPKEATPAATPAAPVANAPQQNPLAALASAFQQGASTQNPYQGLNPFAPIDWAKRTGTDAAETWAAIRRVHDTFAAFLDPNAVSQSVKNVWEQDNAQAQIAKLLLSGGGSAIPGLDQKAMAAQTANAAGTILPLTGNPLNAAWPEGRAAQAAVMVGLPAMQGVMSTDPNEQATGLMWAALTGAVLGVGHVPPQFRAPLTAAFKRWPELEQTLRNLIGLQKTNARLAADGDAQPVADYIQHYLNQGGFEGRVSRLAKAGPTEQTVTTLPTGEIVLKGGQDAAQQAAVLKKVGVGSVPELLAKAATEGISGRAVINAVVGGYKSLGLPYDLRRVNPADVSLGDPTAELKALHNTGDMARTGWAFQNLKAFEGMLGHVHSGLWADHTDPARAILRNLAGHSRAGGSTDLAYQAWLDSMDTLRSQQKLDGDAISRAIWGDQAAFDKLPPEGRMIAKQWRLFGNAVMQESKSTGYSKDFIGNWLPMLMKGGQTAADRAATAFKTASKGHKVEALRVDAEGRLIGTPRFDTAWQANTEQSMHRSNLVNELVSPGIKLRDELAKDADAKAIRKLSVTDMAAATAKAKEYAKNYYPDFHTNFFDIARQWNARGLKAIRTHQALNQLTEAVGKNGQPLVITTTDPHEAALWRSKDYKALPGRAFDGYLFHPEFHGDIAKYVDHSAKGLQDVQGLKQLLALEGKSVGWIMYSPLIHGVNMASRMGAAAMMNPLTIASYLAKGRALSPHMADVESLALRKEAIDAGFVPPYRNRNWFDNLSGRTGDALGHIEAPPAELAPKDLPGLAAKFNHAHEAMNSFFWNWVKDFGTMMFYIEKQAALRHGFTETDARVHAADRAKAWVGLVNPEDHGHPALHDAARMVMFAPNWWLSWAKLMAPAFGSVGMGKGHTVYAAYQGAKFIAAAWALQKITGNLANFALTATTPWSGDGHFQDRNLPGNQDRIEATAPWLDNVPGFAGVTATDERTGGRRTLENPLARQMRDTEMALGLESGHPGGPLNALEHPEDLQDGLTKVAISRLSPLLNGLAALANVDLYRSMTTGSMAHVNPDQPADLDPRNIAYAALVMSPLGSQWAEKMTAAASDPKAMQLTDGPFGTKIPQAMRSIVGDTTAATERVLFSWLTGVNPPYDYAEKTRGQVPSDMDYRKYAAARADYEQQMAALSAQALGGQITPAQWLQQYQQVHGTYSTIAETTFKNAPHYVNGAAGMLNDWEALYGQATAPDGSIDYGKLDQLQAQFRNDPRHSAAELQRMDGLLKANDSKFPMLALYHSTEAAYGKFQEDYAAQHGLDINRLRAEISEYSALYGDPHASTAYLRQHHDLAAYEAAKRRQFETTPLGLMWGLLYSSSTAARYMQAHHLTVADIEQEAQAS